MPFLSEQEIRERIRRPGVADRLLELGLLGHGELPVDLSKVARAERELAKAVISLASEKPSGRERILFRLLISGAGTKRWLTGVQRFRRVGGTLGEVEEFIKGAYEARDSVIKTLESEVSRGGGLPPIFSHGVIPNLEGGFNNRHIIPAEIALTRLRQESEKPKTA